MGTIIRPLADTAAEPPLRRAVVTVYRTRAEQVSVAGFAALGPLVEFSAEELRDARGDICDRDILDVELRYRCGPRFGADVPLREGCDITFTEERGGEWDEVPETTPLYPAPVGETAPTLFDLLPLLRGFAERHAGQ